MSRKTLSTAIDAAFGRRSLIEPMTPITLSRTHIKEADRVGGIELMLRWPADLPAPRAAPTRDAGAHEKAAAEAIVGPACVTVGLVPVHVRVTWARPPSSWEPDPERALEAIPCLAVTIIGRRWVHATGRPKPLRMWAHHRRDP